MPDRDKMNSVERFDNALAFKPVDRLPAIEWAPWWGLTLDRWYGTDRRYQW